MTSENSMQKLHELRETLMEELHKITKKETEMTTATLDTVYKLIESIKGIDKIFMLNDIDEEYSQTGGSSHRGNSYARQRDSRGRYSGIEWPTPTRPRRYSRSDRQEMLMDCLEELKAKAPSDKAMEAIEMVMAQIRLGE